MASHQDDPRFTPRQRELLRDLEVVGRLKDIRDAEQLREQLAPKWWEAGVGLLQFAAALGLLAALIQYPGLRQDRLSQLIVFFFVVMILSLVLGFEFLIFKLYHIRRANALAQRRIDHLERRLETLERDNPPSGVASAASSGVPPSV